MPSNLNVTRGGLYPATITNLNTNESVKFMFNPFEYTISKSNSWTEREGAGKNVPIIHFQQGGPQTLSLTLHFDTQTERTDVRSYTLPLWTMMMIDESTRDATTGKGEPPPVAFEWGRLYFKAIVTQMSETFTVFTDSGIPLRSAVKVDLRQFLDAEAVQPQTGQIANPNATTSSTTMTEGDRIDNVAGNPNDQRRVAEQNNIDDPLNIPPGTQIRK